MTAGKTLPTHPKTHPLCFAMSSSKKSGETSYGIEYERLEEDSSSSFSDPFTAPMEEGYMDVPMTREDYGLQDRGGASGGGGSGDVSYDSAPVSSLGGGGGGGGSGASPTPGSHLTRNTLAAALSSAGALPAFPKSSSSAPSSAQKYTGERRGLWAQMSYNIGYSYFGGLMLGGLVGSVIGVRSSPNSRPRIVFNSVLNWGGKSGAKCGNAAGVLALLYTGLERQFEDVEFDKFPGVVNNTLGMDVFRSYRSDLAIPAGTAFATGVLFTLPRALTMRGLDTARVTIAKRMAVCGMGGLSTMAGVGILSVVGPLVFGERSPFRFA